MSAQFPEALVALWRRSVNTSDDSSFGPQSGSRFDFTLKFEDTILTILPTAILLVFTPFYLRHYYKLPVISAKDPALWVKHAGIISLVILQAVEVAFRVSPDDATDTAKAASIMACLAAVAWPSSCTLSTGTPFSRLRSYFLRRDYLALGCLTAANAGVMLLLVILGEFPKRYQCDKQSVGKEAARGFWGRTLFVWLNATLLFGFRNKLSVDDLPSLGSGFSSARLAAAFEPVWVKRSASSLRLMAATFWSLIWSFISVVPPRLLYIAFSYSQPFLIRSILESVQEGTESEDFRNVLIGATALAHIGVALTRVWYNHMNTRMITKTRGVLTSQILRKTFLLDYEEARKSAALTLMSTDLEGISRVLPRIHEAWAGLIELGVGIYLLSTIVKEASVLVIIPALVSTAISIDLGRRSGPASSAWNDKIEERVAKTSQILSQIKGIKMSATEDSIADYIQHLREAEVWYSKKTRVLDVLSHAAGPIAYTFTPIIVLCGGIFGRGFENGFNATEAFTTLAFIYLASQPIIVILTSWSRLGSLVACFGRVQDYLLLEERIDCRQKNSGPNKGKSVSYRLKDSGYDDSIMQLLDASFSYANAKQALLQASALFGRATTTMLLGPTGAGKSTLLKALLGDAKIFKGLVRVESRQIAFCGQHTWLRNVTIRDCIIGTAKYDEEWYKTVVKFCFLSDIFKLPKGDLSLAGSRGSNLSGGQKQRIALARAIYCRPEILLLDDITSAIDPSTASSIMAGLLGPDGLLKRLGTTVVMVTHAVEFLQFADQVLTLPGDGTILSESGDDAANKHNSEGSVRDSTQDSNEHFHGVYSATPAIVEASESDNDTRLRSEGDVALYGYYMKSVSVWVLLTWLFVTAIVAVMERMPDIFVRIWVDKDPTNNYYFIGYALLGFGGMVAVAAWTWLYFMHLIPESSERLHRALLDSVTKSTLSFLTHTDSGSIVNRFSQDMSLISQDLPMAFLFFFYTLLVVFTNLAILSASAQYAALLLPVILVLLFILQHYYLRTSRQMRHLDLEAKTPLYTHLTEITDGLSHIHAFGWEEHFIEKGLELLDSSQKPFYYMYCIRRWLSLVLDLSVAGITVALVALALNLSSTKQAALGLGLLYTMQMGPELADLIDNWTELETSLGAISRLRTFIEETPREDANNGDGAVPESWPHRGDVRLSGVSAEYATPGSKHKAIRDISMHVEGGTKVGIVGRTGSGKTTLLLTILNFLEFEGSVVIDDVDIATIPRQTLRSRITTISQDMMDLPCSVRDNLVPDEMSGPEGSRVTEDAKLLQVLDRVGLGEHVAAHGGLDGQMEKLGLSAGQKQLLALARALLHNRRTRSKLVLVDEATSSIDYELEAKMQAVMAEAFDDCTVLTIAHREKTIEAVDKVLTMDGGKLVVHEDEGSSPVDDADADNGAAEA